MFGIKPPYATTSQAVPTCRRAAVPFAQPGAPTFNGFAFMRGELKCERLARHAGVCKSWLVVTCTNQGTSFAIAAWRPTVGCAHIRSQLWNRTELRTFGLSLSYGGVRCFVVRSLPRL
jgi:hypothetical protein